MASLRSKEKNEVSELKKVEEQIRRSERLQRIHHIIIAALGALLVASAALHVCEHRRICKK